MRYALDLAMIVFLVLEMSFLFMPRPFHEIMGVAFLVPIILHVWKNRYFLKSLPRGRWPVLRIMGAVIDLALAIACFATIISGCLISNLFADMVPSVIRTSPLLSQVHSLAARGFLVFAGIHLGQHVEGWWQRLLQVFHVSRRSRTARTAAGILVPLIGAGGLFAAYQDRLWQRLMGLHAFMTPALKYQTLGYILVQLGIFLLFTEVGWILWRMAGRRRR